ncbi:MAG: hypothetical protein ISS64_08830 [Desulfobacterales bacterium]|nr:hypothetical protein [Desulfobacterales bacterium]
MSEARVIKIDYGKASGYKMVSATGIYGGPTPSGSLACNFFIESRRPPDELKVTIAPDNQITEEEIYKELPDYQRELQVGVILSPHDAVSIGEWLVRQGKLLLEHTSL